MPLYKYNDGYQHQKNMADSSLENHGRLILQMIPKSFFMIGMPAEMSMRILEYVSAMFQLENTFMDGNDNDALMNYQTRSVLVLNDGPNGAKNWKSGINAFNFADLHRAEYGPNDGLAYDTFMMRTFGRSWLSGNNNVGSNVMTRTHIRYGQFLRGLGLDHAFLTSSPGDSRSVAQLEDIERKYGGVIRRCLTMIPVGSDMPSVSPPDTSLYRIECSLPNSTGGISSGTYGRLLLKNHSQLGKSGRTRAKALSRKGESNQINDMRS